MRKIKYRCTFQIGCNIHSNWVSLCGTPLVGDQITVWDKEGMSGRLFTIIARNWGNRDGQMTIVLGSKYKISPEELLEKGWR